MRVHLILLLVTAWLATSHASPQRNRQGPGQDSVLTMGMKFLGNMRERVTGLFRPRNRPAKGRPQRLPQIPQQPHFANQVHEHVTPGPTNSIFTVVHEEDFVTRAVPAQQTLPLQDDNDSFQPSSFFNSNRPFQGFEQESFSAPKRPNDFGFGNPKDESKFQSTFSREVNTRPVHQNIQSSGFQPGPGIQQVSPPNFSSRPATGFTQFAREAPVRFRPSSSSSSSSVLSSPSSSSSFSSSSSSFKQSSGSVANKPQNLRPLQDTNIPEIFTVADPQRHESNKPPKKFTSSITPSKPSFTHRLAPTQFSSTTRRITPTRPTLKTTPFVVRPTRASRLPSAPVPSGPKKPFLPAKPGTGDRHINTGFKQTVKPKDGDKAAHIAGYEWGYGVLDSGTGNQYFHAEKREEGTTKGSYKIQLPDGRIQTVTYTADDKGFHPIITYEGEAKFPDSRKSTGSNASDS